jgi:DNA/RNA endonuclease YhcR with UshA esterase domain
MKFIKLTITLVIILSGAAVFAQQPENKTDQSISSEPVSPEAAKNYDGSLITVCGKVFGIHTGQSGVSMLNFGAAYPENTFTAVIFADDASKFEKAEEYKGKQLCVTGRVKLYKGKAEIVLKDRNQLKIQ